MPAWLVFHASMTSRLETLKVEVFDSKVPVTETISPTLGPATDTEIQVKSSILPQYQRKAVCSLTSQCHGGCGPDSHLDRPTDGQALDICAWLNSKRNASQ